MNRAVLARALTLAFAGLMLSGPAAHAQFLAPALDDAGSDLRLRQPSLRLKSMGGIYLAVADENNEINLWDFAGSANGLLRDRDSTSLDLFVDLNGRADRHTVGAFERETDRTSTTLLGLQAVGRSRDKFAAGVEGGVVSIDRGLPAQANAYESRKIRQPVALAALNGRMMRGRMSWALRGILSRESTEQTLRRPTVDGDQIRLEGGDAVGYPTVFELVEGSAPTSGLGFGLGYDVGKIGELAVNLDAIHTNVRGESNSARRIYEVEEKRPIRELSGSAILSPKPWFTIGGQVGRMSYNSDETYRFTLSGGQGTTPRIARGTRLTRDFEQKYLRSRAWIAPPSVSALKIGADVNVRYDREDITPGTGASSFNAFLVSIQGDTLALPPSIVDERQELRHWDAGLGLAYAISPRLLASVEGHRFNNARDGLAVHARQRITDLRAGLELGLDPAWKVRFGAAHRADDPDIFLADNERVRNTFTAGVGWARPTSSYAVDAGVEVARASTDFPDPTEGTGSGLRLFLYNRWGF